MIHPNTGHPRRWRPGSLLLVSLFLSLLASLVSITPAFAQAQQNVAAEESQVVEPQLEVVTKGSVIDSSNPAANTAPPLALQTASDTTEETPATAQTADTALPHDLSPWGMFMQADWVVKAVMIGLALAAIATWTVLVAKTRELRTLVKEQKHTLLVVTEATTLKAAHHTLEETRGNTQFTHAAAHELKLSAKSLADTEGVKERVASNLERLEAARARAITRGTSILATIGATAPFVGLFGTVWGIMNSFIGISKAQTTNLAVVAPGIAEALLATALGLVAAIPAVVIYNHFARQIAAYKALVGDTSAAILRLVSRDLSHYIVAGVMVTGVTAGVHNSGAQQAETGN